MTDAPVARHRDISERELGTPLLSQAMLLLL